MNDITRRLNRDYFFPIDAAIENSLRCPPSPVCQMCKGRLLPFRYALVTTSANRGLYVFVVCSIDCLQLFRSGLPIKKSQARRCTWCQRYIIPGSVSSPVSDRQLRLHIATRDMGFRSYRHGIAVVVCCSDECTEAIWRTSVCDSGETGDEAADDASL